LQAPEDFDAFLRGLLENPSSGTQRRFSSDDRALIERMLRAMEEGAHGVILVKHPDERLEYLIANADRIQAIGLMAQAIDRNAQIASERRRG
jgi:peptide deformylase